MPDRNEELSVARAAVRAAARACRAVQETRIDANTIEKKDKSPVTVADFAAQSIVCRAIQHAHTGKETKYYTNQVFEGVCPLALTPWGYVLKAADRALPFKDMVWRARGDKKVAKRAGLLKNKWMKRVSLALLDINAQLVPRAAQPLETVGV